MNIVREKVNAYINYESHIPKKKTLQSSIIMLCMVGIPVSLYGAYSNITRLILLPFLLIFIFWAIYLLINTENKKAQFVLFLGGFSLIISLLFIIASYKFALLIYKVPMFYMLLIIILYIIANIINILNVQRLIKRGYYEKDSKNKKPTALFIAMSVFGLSMGNMLNNARQEVVIAILVSLLLFMAFIFTTGTHNFLKYYYVRTYN